MATEYNDTDFAENVDDSKSFWKSFKLFFPEIAILLAFVFSYVQRLNFDFWNDEIYTLRHYTFTSIQKTVGSYPVPNNHVFFNLVDNIYLKVIQVDSFTALIEHPWMLRILFFCYALLTLFLTYLLARRLFNRTTARLAVIILITTIPYFNFALQARGYGLSTLLLVGMVYGCLAYERSQRPISLLLIGLTAAAAVYTLPSNLLPIGAILLPYGFLFLWEVIRYRKKSIPSFSIAFRQNIAIRIILALIAGIGVALLCYLPIFKDVFFNDYVTAATPLDFPKLQFYLTHIGIGIVSGRGILVIIACIGLLVGGLVGRRMWPVLLFLSVAVLPIIIIYVQGVSPPLRTFVYFAPFTALILAAGLDGFALRLLPKGRTITLYFPIGLSIYVLTAMYFEVQKIETHLAKDIQSGNKSQDLYAQYYSGHYYPLKAVKQLKNMKAANDLPVVISGCEPHGVPNYLMALDVPFHRQDELDNLLSTNDSLYIMTNHPEPFLHLNGYHARMINRSLNYHNILVFSKSAAGYAAINELERLHATYRDSVGFVLNVFSKGSYAHISDSADCYFVTDSTYKHVGDLIEFAARKPYICYLNMTGTASATIKAVAYDRRREIDLPAALTMPNAYLGKLTEPLTGMRPAHDTAERLDSTRTFSSMYTTETGRLEPRQTLKISLDASFQPQTGALLVISIVYKNEPVVWKGIPLKDYWLEGAQWQRVVAAYTLPNDLLDRDELSIYVWNPKKEVVLVDNLKVEPFRFSEP